MFKDTDVRFNDILQNRHSKKYIYNLNYVLEGLSLIKHIKMNEI